MPKHHPPAVLVEWQAATQAWADEKAANQLTAPTLARARAAWRAIRDDPRLEPSRDALEIMDELMQSVH